MDHKSRCKIEIKDQDMLNNFTIFLFWLSWHRSWILRNFIFIWWNKNHNIWLESAFLTVYFIDNCVIMFHVIDLFFSKKVNHPVIPMIRQIQTLYGSCWYNQCSEQYSFPWFLFVIEIKTSQELSFCSFPYYISYQLSTVVDSNLLKKTCSMQKMIIKITPVYSKRFFHGFLPNKYNKFQTVAIDIITWISSPKRRQNSVFLLTKFND